MSDISVLTATKDKETKNTVRFIIDDPEGEVSGTIYINKPCACESLKIKVKRID